MNKYCFACFFKCNSVSKHAQKSQHEMKQVEESKSATLLRVVKINSVDFLLK